MATIGGSAGNDNLVGTASADTMNGYGGNDTIDGGAENDEITGGNGNDILYGGLGNDTLIGDVIARDPAFTGYNVMYGGEGNDSFYGGLLGDSMYGEGGNDTFYVRGTAGAGDYHGGTNTNGAPESDTINITNFLNGYNPAGVSYVSLQISTMSGIENIFNTSGRDAHIISIGGNLDLSNTNLANITLVRGTDGADTIIGHNVVNTANSTVRGITIDGKGGDDKITGSEQADNLTGGDGADTLQGRDGNDYLTGGNGNDVVIGGNGVDQLLGGAGQDILAGQAGNDQLTGGTEADQFYFNLNGGQDIIVDFQDGIDKIVLGADVKNISLFSSNGSAALDLFDATSSTPHTYVLLQGVSASQIDGSDFVFP
ncbi:calcium-binding protein [Aureimonas sp. AU12]|uniref:calcium-binding protein n=1 Tax=Aureimonas sp. AU12 TaxID=1638161 RepID=UPI000780E634|nr:calcium-binding protein [Aureimonas sp. AU12]